MHREVTLLHRPKVGLIGMASQSPSLLSFKATLSSMAVIHVQLAPVHPDSPSMDQVQDISLLCLLVKSESYLYTTNVCLEEMLVKP